MPFKDNFDNLCINDFVNKIKVYISYNKINREAKFDKTKDINEFYIYSYIFYL